MPTEEMKEGREQYWSELDDQGKIERMRSEIKHLKSQNSELIESVQQLLRHSHGDRGLLVVPIGRQYPARVHMFSSGSGPQKDDVYF